MANRVVSHGYFRFLIKNTKPKTSRNKPKAESAVCFFHSFYRRWCMSTRAWYLAAGIKTQLPPPQGQLPPTSRSGRWACPRSSPFTNCLVQLSSEGAVRVGHRRRQAHLPNLRVLAGAWWIPLVVFNVEIVIVGTISLARPAAWAV